MDKKGKIEALQVHRENLLEYYNECLSHHTNYVNKLQPTGEEATKMEKWATELDATYRKWTKFIDQYIREAVDCEPYDEPFENQIADTSTEGIEARLRSNQRRLAVELEDSQLRESRRVEDIRRRH